MLLNLIIIIFILLSNIITISSIEPTTTDIFDKDLPLCVSNANNYQQVKECEKNDTYCGNWKYLNQATKDISWYPLHCRYRDVTPIQARKCMKNHTLAFIGDSMIRNLGLGVAFFLSDRLEFGANNEISYDKYMEKDGNDFIPHSRKVSNAFIFPIPTEKLKNNWTWQVQIWELHSRSLIQHGQVEKVLMNELHEKHPEVLNPIDFALWAHGINDYGWFETLPYGPKFYEQMTGEWLRIKDTMKVPSVWMSMDSNCKENYKPGGLYMGDWIDDKTKERGFQMVEDSNQYVHTKLRELKLPYYDATEVLRSPQRCELSYNGLHVKMWVNIVRAKILFNYLCDEDFNWVAKVERFI